MALLTDNYHIKKLNKYGINIKTKYIVGNTILERNTDNSNNDDIISGVRYEKEYYQSNQLLHVEKNFDTRIEYTFISKEIENKEYTCPNCGMHSKLKDFLEGCPYCRTYYNIDYTNKDLGSKYHYDRVLKNNTYRIATAIVDIIFSLAISLIFIKTTGRTFNSYDISKIFIYGLILAGILYYFFYILDAYIVLTPIKKYKDKQNQKQIDFWNRTKIDKKKFFNNFNYEVRKKYYSEENIIDYDVLDYISFQEFTKNNNLYIEVVAEVRVVYYENNKIIPKTMNQKYIMKKLNTESLKLNNAENFIKCSTCGASIDVEKGECSYCHTKIKYFQDWILE